MSSSKALCSLNLFLCSPSDILRIDSTNGDALYVRGLCLYYEDCIDKAVQFFVQALRMAPDHEKARLACRVSSINLLFVFIENILRLLWFSCLSFRHCTMQGKCFHSTNAVLLFHSRNCILLVWMHLMLPLGQGSLAKKKIPPQLNQTRHSSLCCLVLTANKLMQLPI